MELAKSRTTIRKLSDCIGTTVVSSSNESSDDDFSSKSNDIEQQDVEFGADYLYTTNVSAEQFLLQISALYRIVDCSSFNHF